MDYVMIVIWGGIFFMNYKVYEKMKKAQPDKTPWFYIIVMGMAVIMAVVTVIEIMIGAIL
jgi:hypothetical protein